MRRDPALEDALAKGEFIFEEYRFCGEVATVNSELQSETSTATFIEVTETPVYLPLSGQTLSFYGEGARWI